MNTGRAEKSGFTHTVTTVQGPGDRDGPNDESKKGMKEQKVKGEELEGP
jgi:hypothetical protein